MNAEGDSMTKPPSPAPPDPCQPLAYRNLAFLDSDDARAIRILAEYLQPLAAFERHRVHDTIVFFGSARIGEGGPLGRYYVEARELARQVTEPSRAQPAPARPFVVAT